MDNDYSENQKILETLGRTVESGSPLQHFAVDQMTKLVRGEAAARDRGKYEPEKKEKTHQPHIREGTFFLQTRGGKFLYACFGEEANVIVLPIGAVPISELSQIVTEVITGYRPVEPEDCNYLYIKGQGDVKPTPESFAIWKGDSLTLISEEPILSDVTYQGNKGPNWGRIEISVSRGSSNTHGMDVITPAGEYISYFIPWESLVIRTSAYDLSWDGSPEKDKEFHYNKGKFGARAYAVVKNKEETRRLIPQFWQIIKRLIGDDKVVAMSSTAEGMLPLTLGEARRQYDVRAVVSQKHMKFKGVKPESWDCEGEGFPIYYFPMGNNEFGLLMDRSNSAYMIPYLFSKTRWYEKGIGIDRLEVTTD